MNLPTVPDGWVYFATWQDAIFSVLALILIALLIVWWKQQAALWFRVSIASLLVAVLLSIGSYYIFVIAPYEVGCAELCTGWRGYPRRFALVALDESTWVGPLDFAVNLILLWLLILTTTVVWRILSVTLNWRQRPVRARILAFLAVWLIPWAMLPRFLNPPQPVFAGEDLRVANNALRAAEFTYNITGLWVQRLAVEDIRTVEGIGGAVAIAGQNATTKQVCLRGYTYFYLPWSRYRILLEPASVSSVQMLPVPLTGSCWK